MCPDSSMWCACFIGRFGCCFTQTDGTRPRGPIVRAARAATGFEGKREFSPCVVSSGPPPPPTPFPPRRLISPACVLHAVPVYHGSLPMGGVPGSLTPYPLQRLKENEHQHESNNIPTYTIHYNCTSTIKLQMFTTSCVTCIF